MGLSYDQTVNGLQQMIEKGYFEGDYIDHGSHEIVFPKRKNAVDAVSSIEHFSDAVDQLIDAFVRSVVKTLFLRARAYDSHSFRVAALLCSSIFISACSVLNVLCRF